MGEKKKKTLPKSRKIVNFTFYKIPNLFSWKSNKICWEKIIGIVCEMELLDVQHGLGWISSFPYTMMKTSNYIRLLLTPSVNQLVNTRRVILVSYVLDWLIYLKVEPQDIEIIKSCKKVETSAWKHWPSYLSLDILTWCL